MNFSANGIQLSYSKNTIVKNFSLDIPDKKITALIGANGSGKSTVLKAMCRIMRPDKGHILLDGKAIHQQSTKEVAKRLTILPQNPESPDGLTVEELISYGRSPHKSGFGKLNAHDKELIAWALEVTKMTEFADRPLEQLSGGQRQRAWIAMAVAQDTEILFLDEPTTFLDISHQLEVLNLLRSLNEKFGRTIIMVVHDLNHASRYADYIVAIKKGAILSQGSPKQVITEQTCKDVFGVEADIIYDPRSALPLCIPFSVC